MRALTFWPEWAYAIHNLWKRVENRGRALPIGETFALHAGKSIGGRSGEVVIREQFKTGKPESCFYCEGEQFEGHICEHCGKIA